MKSNVNFYEAALPKKKEKVVGIALKTIATDLWNRLLNNV